MNLAANNDANGVTLVAAEAHVRIIPSERKRLPLSELASPRPRKYREMPAARS